MQKKVKLKLTGYAWTPEQRAEAEGKGVVINNVGFEDGSRYELSEGSYECDGPVKGTSESGSVPALFGNPTKITVEY